jgi:outer membrane protein assembly factor BamB
VAQAADEYQSQWPEWRGPLRTGEAPHANPPVSWSEDSNVHWKTALPGLGHSSPVVWEDSIFVTTAIAFGPHLDPVPVTAPGAHDNKDVTQRHRFLVLCVDRQSGVIRWQKEVADALPHEGSHNTGSQASASAVTDGRRVYADFGSNGVYALDFDGNVVWSRDLGRMQSKHAHGEGASPTLQDGHLIVNRDHEGQSFIAALAAETGSTLWKRERPEVTSWASPLIVSHNNRYQVGVAGTSRTRSYDLITGEVIWECDGLSANIVATPVASAGIVVVGSSYEIRAMMGIRLAGATGDITETDHVRWRIRHRTPYVPSMLLVDESVYFLRHYQGILSRRDLVSGEESAGPWRLGLLRDIYASPVAAAGRVYLVDLYGKTLVFEHGDSPKQLAYNQLDDEFSATPALVGDQLILRGRDSIYSLREDVAEEIVAHRRSCAEATVGHATAVPAFRMPRPGN